MTTDIHWDLDKVVERWALLNHPFYQAWSAGTLPVESLQTYAREYGTFIGRLADGWDRVGNAEHATEERHHADLWADFAKALGTTVVEPEIPETKALLDTCDTLFADTDRAWGALYAFEVQQPGTAASKLDGLNAFYDLPDAAKTYFEVHANDPYESVMILDHLDGVDDDGSAVAIAACETMSQALWSALTGVYDGTVPEAERAT